MKRRSGSEEAQPVKPKDPAGKGTGKATPTFWRYGIARFPDVIRYSLFQQASKANYFMRWKAAPIGPDWPEL